jgi:hypothetical protein
MMLGHDRRLGASCAAVLIDSSTNSLAACTSTQPFAMATLAMSGNPTFATDRFKPATAPP